MPAKADTYLKLLIVVLITYSWQPPRATTVQILDLDRLISISSSVVLGHVRRIDVRGQKVPRSIESLIEIKVDTCLLGACTEIVKLRQLGGRFQFSDGVYHQKVSGMPTFYEGERVVVFLEKSTTGRIVVSGLAQGKFSVDGPFDDALISRRLNGLNLVQTDDGEPRKHYPLIDMPQRLDLLVRYLKLRSPAVDLRPLVLPTRVPESHE